MLSCNRMVGRHTGENILQSYEEIASEFHISSKVKYIVTDNASNMKKAFVSLPGFCQSNDTLEDQSSDESDSEFEEEGTQGTEGSTANTVLDKVVTPFNHHSCFAHTLELVVKDGFNSQHQINSVISKCAKLVSFVHKSTIATDSLEGEKRLQSYTPTRWNSQVKMLKSVLAIPQEKLDELEDKAPKITVHERKLMSDIVEILIPFEEATDFAQTENIPSSGYVIPCIRGLQHELTKLLQKYNSNFVRNLKRSFETRLLNLQDQYIYCIASLLDPRFKLKWCTSDDEKESMRKILNDEAGMVSTTVQQPQEKDKEPPAKKEQ